MGATLVIGASENKERYSYKAIKSLKEHKQQVHAIGLRTGKVDDVIVETELIEYTDVETVTMYVGPKNQKHYFDYVVSLKPKRVIFNPGTENPEFFEVLRTNNIEVEIACTLVLLATNQYSS